MPGGKGRRKGLILRRLFCWAGRCASVEAKVTSHDGRGKGEGSDVCMSHRGLSPHPFPVSQGLSSKPAIASCLRLVFRYIARMTERTTHHCSYGHAAVCLRLRAFAVRVPELQGPACGRFMR